MNFGPFINILENYGWPGVLVIILCGCLYYFINKALSKNNIKTTEALTSGFEQMTKTINEQNTTLVSAITEQSQRSNEQLYKLLAQSLKQHDIEKEKQHKRSIQYRLSITDKINEKLNDLMTLYNAQRVVLIEFHNSKENLNGLSFIWYDIQYEVKQKNISSICAKCKDMQISNLSPIINDVIENNGIKAYNADEVEELCNRSSVIYSQLSDELNVQGIIYSALYDEDNDIIGMIALEYSKYELPTNIIDLHDIKEKTAIINELLKFNE